MAERAGAVKSILIRPAVRVFDPILSLAMSGRECVQVHSDRSVPSGRTRNPLGGTCPTLFQIRAPNPRPRRGFSRPA